MEPATNTTITPPINPPISPKRWRRVEELFLAAEGMAPADRLRYLDSACPDDPVVRAEVESLLGAGKGAITEMVQASASSLAAEFRPPDVPVEPARPEPDLVGSMLGPWLVGHEIGSGGMGSVYLAERADSQFQMRAAVKVIRRGMDSGELVARFREERQILAQLNHPNIAQLLDGGITPDGRPYFVMEFVDGSSLSDHCARTAPTVEARCRLFIDICAAVACAHRNLVVHRDLKPGNILVTPEGNPKLLDFGIARFIEVSDGAAKQLTVAARRRYTPDYASPEQVLGLPVTTSADIYSLGALLFQLLAGNRPHRITTYSEEEIRTVVCTDPV